MVGHLGELSPIHFGDGRIIHTILTKYVFISELAPKLMIFEAHGPKYWAQARAQGQNARMGPPTPRTGPMGPCAHFGPGSGLGPNIWAHGHGPMGLGPIIGTGSDLLEPGSDFGGHICRNKKSQT